MPNLWHPQPTDPASMLAFIAGALGFFVAVLVTRLRSAPPTAGDKRSRRSMVGVLVQGFGIALAGGPPHVVGGGLWPLPDPARTTAVVLLMASAVALFAWAARTMGDNWAIVARTRGDHQLVTGGPFALIRNPIYVAMALLMFGLSTATGHTAALIVALPVFTIGTLIRTTEEERLLRAHFGVAYDEYAERVKRFVPGVV
jgi:protein-S-isoprenylcysteine O-methyltransferase Ste14